MGPKLNQPKYRSVIGGLLWFAIATRPDILYAATMADYSSVDSGKAHNEVPEGESTHRSDDRSEK
jgi:hypothetical protein